MITIRVGNVNMYLEGAIPLEVIDEIQETLSYVVPGHRFMPRFKKAEEAGEEEWDGTRTVARRQRGRIKAPTGLYSYVLEILKRRGLRYQTLDERPAVLTMNGWGTEDFIPRDYQRKPMDDGLNRGRGVMQAATGCHGLGQGILMFDGSIKSVEDIEVGELLMGPDSCPRTVLRLIRGNGMMYDAIPVKGEPFSVNENHILTLACSSRRPCDRKQFGDNGMIDIPVKEYLAKPKYFRHIAKLKRASVDWGNSIDLPIDPYALGVFLGDGCVTQLPSFVTEDNEVLQAMGKEAERFGLSLSPYEYGDRIGRYGLTNSNWRSEGKDWKNPIWEHLKKLGLAGRNSSNKFIPKTYQTASRKDRMALLAGLIDTDGGYDGGYDYTSKSKRLADDLAFVARSCGLAAYVKPSKKSSQNGTVGNYWRLFVSGHVDQIPCKIRKKAARKRKQIKNVCHTGLSLEKRSIGEYYGFVLDGNGRYLLDDFTITHNSGKTEMIVGMMAEASAFPAVFYVNSCDLLEQAYDRFKKYIRYNGKPVEIGRVGGGHFDIQPITVATVQTTERALTGEYHKYLFDDVSLDDKTNLNDRQKGELSELVKEAQFVCMDECHHVSCDTIQSVLNKSYSARYRYGCSASPWRDDGLDILIEAAFGRRFCTILASFLIKEGYLVRPNIVFNHFRQALGPASNWAAHYTKYVVENDARNEWIAQRALHYMERKMPTIVLVQRTKHGERLAKLIDGSELLTSSGKKKKTPKARKVILDKMRNRELMCIIATTLLDEGVDVPAASAGIFAGGGKSSTRALQRVGRFIRKDPNDPGKECAEIEEIWDHTKWLGDHAKTRRRILETEPEFNISSNSETMQL